MTDENLKRPFTDEQIFEYWDDLTAEEVSQIDGDADRLMKVLESKLGISEDEAAGEIQNFLDVYQTRAQSRG